MKKVLIVKYFNGGISDSEKEGVRGSFYFAKRLDIFSDPSQISLLQKTTKDSGSTVINFVKWIISGVPYDTNTYFYDNVGHIYSRSSAGTWSLLRSVSESTGPGMELLNDYLYYTQNTQIGRYGPLSTSPTFTDAWQTGLNSSAATRIAPIKQFKEGLAVGHGNYIGWWDGSVWDGDRLILPTGFNVRSLDVIDEYLVIGAWQGTATDNVITNANLGIIFFWNGTSSTYDYFYYVPDGVPNALMNAKNQLLSIVGNAGNIYLGTSPFQNVHKIPKIDKSKYLDVAPGALTSWKNKILIGISISTDSTDSVQGVYQWGAKSTRYPEVLNYGWTISTGTENGTGIAIGATKAIGDSLYIGWSDTSDPGTYGVDRVTSSSAPFASGIYESLIFDDGRDGKDKLAIRLVCRHKALASGESIQLGYKIDRDTSYTTGTVNSTVESKETTLPIPGRFKEFQFEVILATSGSTSPTVTSISFEYDTLEEEGLYA